VVDEVNHRLKGVAFPLEYHAELLGSGTAGTTSQYPVVGWSVAAAIAIFLLLQATFGSWRLAALLFLVLTVAPVGGVLIALASGVGFSLGVLVGLFMVWALAVRNGIQLLRHYQHLEQDEGGRSGPDLVLRGTQERFAPILMSALALGVALLPTVFFGNVAGLEVLRPLAITVLGGLITSTLLSLFILPALYLAVGPVNRRGNPAAERADRVDEPVPAGDPAPVR
jgi:multidrug efflux pump subunit AcrB